ncbi:MAG: hypothetical protein NTZ05_05660 [Chloroflexi bacterium]|nr:hypothetical protein [Chloroflexota bacterium]
MRLPSIGGIPLPIIGVVVLGAAIIFGPRLMGSSPGGIAGSIQPPGLGGSANNNRQPAAPQETEAAASSEAVNAGGASIEPGQAVVGDVVMTLRLADPRHMYDAGTGTAIPDQQGNAPALPKGDAAAGYAVLDGQMRKATNNVDAAQKAAPDAKDGKGPLIRHVALTMKKRSTGDLLAYSEVTADVLRNGRPVLYDQPLIPTIAVGDESLPQGLHYGNNLAFPGKGIYQMFVRVAPNPFLGTAPPAAQFNITFE